jgi:hypothetical protein
MARDRKMICVIGSTQDIGQAGAGWLERIKRRVW